MENNIVIDGVILDKETSDKIRKNSEKILKKDLQFLSDFLEEEDKKNESK